MSRKPKLWQTGLIVIFCGIVANRLFAGLEIGGILRELSRLSVFVGLAILIIGLLRRK